MPSPANSVGQTQPNGILRGMHRRGHGTSLNVGSGRWRVSLSKTEDRR